MGSAELVQIMAALELAEKTILQAHSEIEALTAQLAEARESERAAVVAWLRGKVTPYVETAGYSQSADAIEAGEHLT